MEYKIQAVKLAKDLGGVKGAGKGNPPPAVGSLQKAENIDNIKSGADHSF
ncbi:hypothetical protein I5Q82_00345 [Acutalibacter muris]|uniref:Uncharacterized protein n=1 Tax=Acutalibacter muris TaxID=1796620 RepID=A0AA92LBI4_9FIRM|nr:hypothetical protein [Acutalibacter muris]QQR30239.1 hypothetical protein I5Q82_00345 [Acutalibacter muris]